MARKKEIVTIDAEGRDLNKQFELTEMPATQGERWATQALYLLSQAGTAVPEGAQEAGMAGLASVQLGGLPMLRVLQDPSLDAWKECVNYHVQGMMPQKIFWDQPTCQIEEISTVGLLRMKVLEMHIGFFSPAILSTSDSSSPTTTPPSITKTSRGPLAR